MVQVNRLVIVGGPSAAGKTTLMNSMQQGGIPELCQRLGVDHGCAPIYITIGKLVKRSLPPFVEQVILHYDFLTQSLPGGDFAHLAKLITTSHQVLALTLCVPAKILRERSAVRMRGKLKKIPKSPTDLSIVFDKWKQTQFYKHPAGVLALYNEWFAYLGRYGIANNLIINSSSHDCAPTVFRYSQAEVAQMLAVGPDARPDHFHSRPSRPTDQPEIT